MSAGGPVDWAGLGAEPDLCLVCGADDAVPRFAATFHDSLENAPGYFLAHRVATAHGPIVGCGNCGFVFSSPRFAAADYDQIYRSIPVPHEGVADFDAAKAARFRRLAGIVRRHMPAGKRFIDFGCGDGAFLREMDDAAGMGFEIGAEGRARAGPSEIVLGNWADVAGSHSVPKGGFDYVTAFDVLEHLPRIDEDIALLRSLLKPGGLFFASVPNVRSFVARAMGKRWNMLLLEHLWYFSPQTLGRFLARHGFQEVEVRGVPFDAPIAHIATRLGQTLGMQGAFAPRGILRTSLPAPAGIMLGVYRAK
jgi:SAM-dependent methyltransferase